jgi:hypothetical protein
MLPVCGSHSLCSHASASSPDLVIPPQLFFQEPPKLVVTFGHAALDRHERDVAIPRIRSGRLSVMDVRYPLLHLDHVRGPKPFEPVAFDGMSGIPLLTQYRSVGRGNVDGARVPDKMARDPSSRIWTTAMVARSS